MEFPSSTLDNIKDSIRISEVISKKVRLQKKGKDFFGLCPFHNEKSPSFSVNDEKHFYHCFGCGAHGDSIKFVQETQNLSFVDAVKLLAEEYGIKIPQSFSVTNSIDKSKETKMLEINKVAADWFYENLRSQSNVHVLEYLRKRSIEGHAISSFYLGYAPFDGALLGKYLFSVGYNRQEIVESGLINERGDELVCRFRSRVIFPIKDVRGNIIAFGGRVISKDGLPKYLNSPETLVFKKRNAFYLEELAIKGAKSSDVIFVVEGYIDAMSMHSIGLTTTVATLGTAISEFHLKKLWAKVYTPVICMDGDTGGIAAVDKVIRVSLPLLKPGYSLKFIRLPKGYDPDDLIKTHGSIYFKNLATKTTNLSEIIWETYTRKINLEAPENKALLKKTLLDISDSILDLEVRGFYKKYFLEKLHRLSGGWYSTKFRMNANQSAGSDKNPIEDLTILQRYELALAAIVLTFPNLLQDHVLFENFASIAPKAKALDRTYIAILDSFAGVGLKGGEVGGFSVEEFQKRVKSCVTVAFFDYLCGKRSCFIDTISIKSVDAASDLWFDTFERYNLELMKDEYKLLQQGLESKNLEMAVKLKKEIEGLERKIKVHAMNKDD